MTKENAKKRHGILYILLNIICMSVLATLLVLGTFRWMKSYTLHGQYITVPDVSGMYEVEAGEVLSAAGLRYEIADYKYDKMMIEGGVIEQNNCFLKVRRNMNGSKNLTSFTCTYATAVATSLGRMSSSNTTSLATT